jgi:site-specific recombinase XerC
VLGLAEVDRLHELGGNDTTMAQAVGIHFSRSAGRRERVQRRPGRRAPTVAPLALRFFATKGYAASLDLRLAQEFLGHSAPTTVV